MVSTTWRLLKSLLSLGRSRQHDGIVPWVGKPLDVNTMRTVATLSGICVVESNPGGQLSLLEIPLGLPMRCQRACTVRLPVSVPVPEPPPQPPIPSHILAPPTRRSSFKRTVFAPTFTTVVTGVYRVCVELVKENDRKAGESKSARAETDYRETAIDIRLQPHVGELHGCAVDGAAPNVDTSLHTLP